MYTYCTVKFIDDDREMPVIIKAYDSLDDKDDMIFFYGLSREELISACESGEICEGEWQVISVGETFDEI